MVLRLTFLNTKVRMKKVIPRYKNLFKREKTLPIKIFYIPSELIDPFAEMFIPAALLKPSRLSRAYLY